MSELSSNHPASGYLSQDEFDESGYDGPMVPDPPAFRGTVRASADKIRESNMISKREEEEDRLAQIDSVPKLRTEGERLAFLQGYEAALEACEINDPKLVRQIFDAVKNV